MLVRESFEVVIHWWNRGHGTWSISRLLLFAEGRLDYLSWSSVSSLIKTADRRHRGRLNALLDLLRRLFCD